MRALVFPGQGSQAVGMGVALAGASPAARQVFEEVDDALGEKLSAIMAEGPEDRLMLTANAQPAIMAHAIATLRVLLGEGGYRLPDMAVAVAGHSLGEYSALCAADALSLADTARLLRLRGDAMQAAVPVGQGAMAALLGTDLERATALCAAATEGDEVCAVANDNDVSQVVISGHRTAVERAVGMVREHDIKRGVLLSVSAPFHSALMAPAAAAMEAALASQAVKAPLLPLYANVSAAPVVDPDTIRAQLVEQVTGRVRWRETALALAAAGVTEVVEVGAKVLAPMIKRTVPDMAVRSLTGMDDIENFAKEL